MIYWDNAATTFPKPPEVTKAVGQALVCYGANPGRAGHQMAMETAEQVYACRQEVAEFFGLSDPRGVIFTLNCTMALNIVITGLLSQNGRALCSDLEHNAVVRPLSALTGSRYDVAAWSPNSEETVENFRQKICPNTKLLICTHSSNVFGVTFPITELGKLAHDNGLLFCVDAAQSAGVLSIDMERDNIDYLCVAPHKGLYAPMGMGILLCREPDKIPPFVRGGTGSFSVLADQPIDLPDRLESGTPNTPGICGLRAGLRFVNQQGREAVYTHEMACLQRVYERLVGCSKIRFYTPFPKRNQSAPVLSLNVDGILSERVAEWLDSRGVATRAGLHCAPWAHRRFGTLAEGTVRLAPSAFSTMEQAEKISKLFLEIAEKSLH